VGERSSKERGKDSQRSDGALHEILHKPATQPTRARAFNKMGMYEGFLVSLSGALGKAQFCKRK
jgi:hypothetical protein